MNKIPTVEKFSDEEERALFDAIEADGFVPESIATPEVLARSRQAARNTISEASTNVSIRIAQTDLARVKARALKEGLPYQTLIKSIIHKAVAR